MGRAEKSPGREREMEGKPPPFPPEGGPHFHTGRRRRDSAQEPSLTSWHLSTLPTTVPHPSCRCLLASRASRPKRGTHARSPSPPPPSSLPPIWARRTRAFSAFPGWPGGRLEKGPWERRRGREERVPFLQRFSPYLPPCVGQGGEAPRGHSPVGPPTQALSLVVVAAAAGVHDPVAGGGRQFCGRGQGRRGLGSEQLLEKKKRMVVEALEKERELSEAEAVAGPTRKRRQQRKRERERIETTIGVACC